MKTTLAVALALAVALPLAKAQTASAASAPVSLSVHPRTVDGYNETLKYITFVAVAFYTVGNPESSAVHIQTHDYYFKQELSPGAVFEVIHDLDDSQRDIASVSLAYVEFADGTTWEDPNVSAIVNVENVTVKGHVNDVLNRRAPQLSLYNRVLSAGPQGASSVLQAETDQVIYAKRLLRTQDNEGSAAMFKKVQDMVNNANRHGAVK